MGLLRIDFRPRFVQAHRQQLYSLDAVSVYKSKYYKIAPSSRVDYKHPVTYWDDILRFITWQKPGYVRPSTLLKRLNSYAKKHPLHKALRDLGRLYKTDLILRTIDDIQLQASIESLLSKVEHSNKFSNAVTLGNYGSFDWPTQSERDTASGCRMLI